MTNYKGFPVFLKIGCISMKIVEVFALLIFTIMFFFLINMLFNILNTDVVKSAIYKNYTNLTYNRSAVAFNIFDNVILGSFIILFVGLVFIIIYMLINGDI